MNSVTHELIPAKWAALALVLAFSFGCEEETERDVEVPSVVDMKPPNQPLLNGAQPLPASQASQTPPPWAGRVSPDGGFPCEVDQILAVSCRRCHFDPQENDAPFALVKYEDIEKMRSGKPISVLMAQMVEADLMPPLDEPVEPKVSPLTVEQKKTLLQWLGEGAKKSKEKCR